MRPFTCIAAALLLVLLAASPSLARVATIQTTAPLQDHAEPSVKAAFKEAVDAAVKGAMAMGLQWVQISKAFVLEDAVAIQILATDTDPQAGKETPDSDADPGAGSDRQLESDM